MQKAKQFLVGCLGLLFICGAIYIFTDCGGPSTTVARPTATEPYRRAAPTAAAETPVETYLRDARQVQWNVGLELTNLGKLLTEPKLDDGLWRDQVDVGITVTRLWAERAPQLSPVPPEMTAIHAELVASCSFVEAAMDHLESALVDLDPAELDAGMAAMDSATLHFTEYRALVSAFQGE